MTIGIGTTVTDIVGRILGVVIWENPNFQEWVTVRSWSPVMTRYAEFPMKRAELIEITDPKVLQTINEDDREIRKAYEHNAIDITLMTGDNKWFRELVTRNPDLYKK